MKKILKGLTRAMCALALMFVVSFSLVGCAKTEARNNTVSNTSTSVEPEQQQEQTVESEKMFSGMYEFTRELNFGDRYYQDKEELLTHFNTRDENGVYYAAKIRGFEEFAKAITTESESQEFYALYFSKSGEVIDFTHKDGEYTKLESKAHDFSYTYSEDAYQSSNSDIRLEYNEETKAVTLYFTFTYSEGGKTVKSPLQLKAELSLVPNSEEMFTGTEFELVNSSVKLSTTETDPLALDAKMQALATLFGVESADEGEIVSAVMDKMSGTHLLVNESTTRIVTKNVNTYKIVAAEDSLFKLFGSAEAKVLEHNLDFASRANTLVFEVVIDETTTFTFTYSKLA